MPANLPLSSVPCWDRGGARCTFWSVDDFMASQRRLDFVAAAGRPLVTLARHVRGACASRRRLFSIVLRWIDAGDGVRRAGSAGYADANFAGAVSVISEWMRSNPRPPDAYANSLELILQSSAEAGRSLRRLADCLLT